MGLSKIVDEMFFDKWTPESAYVFGLLASDGTITKNPRGSEYMEFVSTDLELIYLVKNALSSNHKIGKKMRKLNQKQTYRLQVGNKHLIKRLKELGLEKKKTSLFRLPKIPKKVFRHFVRGFLDGDGCVKDGKYYSQERSQYRRYSQVIFTCEHKSFLKDLLKNLKRYADTEGGSLYSGTRCCRLLFSKCDSVRLFNYLYCAGERNMFLQRKYSAFREIIFEKGR